MDSLQGVSRACRCGVRGGAPQNVLRTQPRRDEAPRLVFISSEPQTPVADPAQACPGSLQSSRWEGSSGDGARPAQAPHTWSLPPENPGVITIKTRCRGERGRGEVPLGRNAGIKRN